MRKKGTARYEAVVTEQMLRTALSNLIETAKPFAHQRGTAERKALWADIRWAEHVLGR